MPGYDDAIKSMTEKAKEEIETKKDDGEIK
jgi:hypothetical protein